MCFGLPGRLTAAIVFLFALADWAVAAPRPNLRDDPPRPVRYKPDGEGLVITDGTLSFNRPLYGFPSAFRVDAGDRPQFSFYLPGRGGVVRLGFDGPPGSKWFTDAAHVITHYQAASVVYSIADPALGPSPLTLTAIAAHDSESLLLRIDVPPDTKAGEVLLAYGGPAGDKGRRDGDIGTESAPVSEFFALRPEHCLASKVAIDGATFSVIRASVRIAGVTEPGTRLGVADARHWDAPSDLLASQGRPTDTPVVVGRIPIPKTGAPLFVAVQNVRADTPDPLGYDALAAAFDRAQSHWLAVSRQLRVDTPDAYVNAAVPALCVAAEGIWDPAARAYMHGAVAWRRPLLGWRGPYTGDALGQHDRTRAHLDTFFARQNVSPPPATRPGPDTDANLARCERALHSDGDLTRSHYDMNLVAIDALIRHLLWTGDRDYAAKVWPVLERHLAWERRLFRRDFDGLPLYEAYAAIWASDDLQYSGGGVTHATAYNLYHNVMAARIAQWLGHDPAPYAEEAAAIRKALDRHLWLADRGWFAEFKDYLGDRRVHPSAALWTHYHTIDSHAATPLQAWQMCRYVDTQIPHLPIRTTDASLPALATLSTTNWHPYMWSTNNVVMAEVVHTALADFQSDRSARGLATLKAALLDSMYLGQCPGNLGMTTFYDAYRGESQRDFADAVGITSRAIVEGFFGVRPDAIAGSLTIRPGFPDDWDHATLTHPDVIFAYRRSGASETYYVKSHLPGPCRLVLELPARTARLASVTVNGTPTTWRALEDSVGRPRFLIESPHAACWDVAITWAESPPLATPVDLGPVAPGAPVAARFPTCTVIDPLDPQSCLADVQSSGDSLHARAAGEPGHRTAFALVRQGDFTWAVPIAFEIPRADPPVASTRPDAERCEPIDLTAAFNDRVTDIFRHEYRSPRSPFCSLSIPINALGGWCTIKATADINDTGLRALAGAAGRLTLSSGLPLKTPGPGTAPNVAFVSQWDNHPRRVTVPLTGRADRAYFLLAGSTTNMQSRIENGVIDVTYADGPTTHLALVNPTNWWPIEQDFFVDDYAFATGAQPPARLDLKTGLLRRPTKGHGGLIPGGSATLLELPLDPAKDLRSLTLRSTAIESIVGLMAVTLERPTRVGAGTEAGTR